MEASVIRVGRSRRNIYKTKRNIYKNKSLNTELGQPVALLRRH
jgi:hypothetical protein